MRGLSSNVFGPTTPKALKEQADLAALAVDVTRMMVEEDVQNGGPLANLTSAEEYQKKALEIGSMIRLDDLNEVGILRLRVGSLDKALAMRIAELAARVLVGR